MELLWWLLRSSCWRRFDRNRGAGYSRHDHHPRRRDRTSGHAGDGQSSAGGISPCWCCSRSRLRAGIVTGYFGAKSFGATKWGVRGGDRRNHRNLHGVSAWSLAVIGAIAGELIAGKRLLTPATQGGEHCSGTLGDGWQAHIALAWYIFLVTVPSPSELQAELPDIKRCDYVPCFREPFRAL